MEGGPCATEGSKDKVGRVWGYGRVGPLASQFGDVVGLLHHL
jgi:hypothetical protein